MVHAWLSNSRVNSQTLTSLRVYLVSVSQLRSKHIFCKLGGLTVDLCKLVSLARVTRVQLKKKISVIWRRFVSTAPLQCRNFASFILCLSLFFIHGELELLRRCESASRDQTTHDTAMRCGGCLVLLEAASPTHEHGELKRRLLLVSMTSLREAWKPRVPRAITHEVHDELERSRESR